LSALASNLRPRSATELIDAGIQLARAHYGPLVVLSAIVAAPGLVINTINARLVAAQPIELGANILRIIPLSFLGMCVTAVGFGALVASASAAYLTGQPLEPAAALRQALARAGRLVGVLLLAYLIMAGGLLVTGVLLGILTPMVIRGGSSVVATGLFGLVALGGVVGSIAWLLVALPRYANAVPPVMVENAGVLTALRRSRELSRGSARRILGLVLLTVVILVVLTVMVGEVVAALFGNRTLANALGGFVLIPLYPATAAVMTLLYYDLRIRREGYDIELMARGLEDAPAADLPGAPPADARTGQPSF